VARTGKAFLLELAPGILLAPLAARLADRRDLLRTLVAVALLQALRLVPLLLAHEAPRPAVLYMVILLQASLMAMFDPAKNAL
jgi:hypothetical protein